MRMTFADYEVLTSLINQIYAESRLTGACWGCHNCTVHARNCPTMSPRPGRYVKPRRGQNHFSGSVTAPVSSDTQTGTDKA